MKAEGALPVMEALVAKKSAILREWLARTLESYGDSASCFLIQEKDPFRNPVGYTLRQGFPVLLDALVGGMDAATIMPVLDGIVRIRAVQDFTAGQAVAFIFLLKRVIREELKGEVRVQPGGDGLAAVEERIDEMALLAFDLFMKCRERIYEIRVNEAKRRLGLWLKRQAVAGRTGESENRGNGDANPAIANSPVPRFSVSPIPE